MWKLTKIKPLSILSNLKYPRMKAWFIIPVILFSIGIVTLLWALAEKPNAQKNGFKRKFGSNYLVTEFSQLDKNPKFNKIAGYTNSDLYISTKQIGEIFIFNYATRKINTLIIPTGDFYKNRPDDKIVTIVRPPKVYFINFNAASVNIRELHSNYKKDISFGTPSFTKAVIPTSGVLSVRVGNNKTRDQLFSRFDLSSGKGISQATGTELLHDGGISTDGTLNYDNVSSVYTYVYYYKNKFLIFDSTFSLLREGKTIDTFTQFQIALKEIEHNSDKSVSITNGGPQKIINPKSFSFGNYLYNSSKLMADNENEQLFQSNDVIDVYRLDNLAYLASFYIPLQSGNHLVDFCIWNDFLVVLYKTGIVAYNIKNMQLLD